MVLMLIKGIVGHGLNKLSDGILHREKDSAEIADINYFACNLCVGRRRNPGNCEWRRMGGRWNGGGNRRRG